MSESSLEMTKISTTQAGIIRPFRIPEAKSKFLKIPAKQYQ
jgi:hypothetical protein